MSATSPYRPTQYRRHAREVDLGNEVRIFVSGGEMTLVGFRAGLGAAFDASVVMDRRQLAEYRDAINAVLVATDPS